MSATIYPPQDNLVGPIIAALTTAIKTQIPSITTIYQQPTDAIPEDGSVQFPYELELDDTQYPGVLRVKLNLYLTQCFKRNRLDDVYARMQPYIYPWLMTLTAWRNLILQPAGGFTTDDITIDKRMRIVPVSINGTPYICLTWKIQIVTEFPVDMNES